MKTIIGITGQISSGKSTAAAYLAGMHLPGAAIIPFAKPLKDLAYSMGWNGKKDDKGRRLLKLLGTECGRECIHENIWVTMWRTAVKESEATFIVADDVRFNNEAEAIIKEGGRLIRLTRCTDVAQPDHASEVGIDSRLITVTIENSGTISELCTALLREVE